MKPIVLAIVLITICYNVFGQTDTSFANSDLSKMETQKDIYLRKSKNHKITAFVFLGVGTATVITGAMMMGTAKNNDFVIPTDEKTYDGAGLILLGMLVDLGSIPFFIAASNNKEKAMSFSVINEPIPKEMIAQIKQHSIPALSVRWKF